MKIKVSGKAKNVQSKLIVKAVKFYGEYLLGPRLYDKIDLKIHVSKRFLKKGIDGYCDWMDKNSSPREFEITLRPSLSEEAVLMLLAHEMVHLKQFAKNEMKHYSRNNAINYKGKIFADDTDYWERPWEIEAYGRERGLYHKFINSLK
jgi:hypothetical protein